jgi:hypothetical protein
MEVNRGTFAEERMMTLRTCNDYICHDQSSLDVHALKLVYAGLKICMTSLSSRLDYTIVMVSRFDLLYNIYLRKAFIKTNNMMRSPSSKQLDDWAVIYTCRIRSSTYSVAWDKAIHPPRPGLGVWSISSRSSPASLPGGVRYEVGIGVD